MSNVMSLGRASDNGEIMSVRDTLEDVLSDIGANGALKNGQKLLVIALDDNDGQYYVSWYQCGMTMSKCISLCEVAKAKFLSEMNY